MATANYTGYKYYSGGWSSWKSWGSGKGYVTPAGTNYRTVFSITVSPSTNYKIDTITLTFGATGPTSSFQMKGYLLTSEPTNYSTAPSSYIGYCGSGYFNGSASGKDYTLIFTPTTNITTATTLYVWLDTTNTSSTYVQAYTFAQSNMSTPVISATESQQGYTLTFNANNGTAGSTTSILVPYGSSTTIPNGAIPSRAGYKFLGWSFSSTATTASYQVGSSISSTNMNNQNRTLYAVWEEVTLILWIASDIGRDATSTTNGLNSNGSIILTYYMPSAGYPWVYNASNGNWLNQEGYLSSAGWYHRESGTGSSSTDNREYRYTISSISNPTTATLNSSNYDSIIASKWTALCYINSSTPIRVMYSTSSYELSRPDGCPTSFTLTVNNATKTFTDTASKIQWCSSLPTPTITNDITGYSFSGYATSASTTSVTYSADDLAWDSYMNGATLYAIFTKAKTANTVTLNTGSNNVTATRTIAASIIYGTGSKSGGGITYSGSYTLIPTKSGYEFKGWSTSSSDGIVHYATVLEALQDNYNSNLYPVWQSTGQLIWIYNNTNTDWEQALCKIYSADDNKWCDAIPWIYTSNGWTRNQ